MTTNTNAEQKNSAPLAESASNTENSSRINSIITQNPGNVSSVKFKVGLNHKYINKNGAGDLSDVGSWTNTELNFTELAAHIGKGHAWMPALVDDGMRRKKIYCNHAEVLSLDIDKGLTIADFLNHDYARHCGLVIESYSSSPELEKFRVIFRLPGVLKDDDNKQSTFDWSGVSNSDRVINRAESQLSDGERSTIGSEWSSQDAGDCTGSCESGEICATGEQWGVLSGSGGTCERNGAGMGFDKHLSTKHTATPSASEQADKLRARLIHLGGSGVSAGDYSELSDPEKVERIRQKITKYQTYQVINFLNRYLIFKVEQADKSCKDASRFYFGALKRIAILINEGAELPLSFILEALDWWEAKVNTEKTKVTAGLTSFGSPMPTQANSDMTIAEFEDILLSYGSGNGYVKGSGTNPEIFNAIIGTARQFGAHATQRVWSRWEAQNPGDWSEPFDKVLDRAIGYGTSNDSAGMGVTFGSTMYLLKNWGYEPPKRKQRELTQEEKQAAFDAMMEATTEATNRLWPVTKSFNQRYLSADMIPLKEGVITMVSSACGSGKTVMGKGAITNYALSVGLTFEDLTIRVPGYRNALGQQTAKRWGIAHIHNLRKDEKPDDVAQLSLCVDSLLNIKLESIGLYEVWVLDEVVNVLKHVLAGDTLGARHGEILQHLFQCLNKVLRQGGTVLCMEEDIPDYAISSLSNLLGGAFPIELYENTFYGNQYDVKIGAGHISGWQAAIIRDLVAGQKLIVVADSQKLLEQLEYAIVNAGMDTKILRVDSTTKDAEVVQKFMTTPDTILEKGGYQLVLMSPTAESGTSIELPGFNKVYASFFHLDTRSQLQMLERYRLSVPRIIHCRESNKRNAHRLDVVSILKDDKARMIRSIEQSNVFGQLCDVIDNDPNNERLVKWSVDGQIRLANIGNDVYEVKVNTEIATFEVQSTALKINMLENLEKNMKRRGNTVSLCEWQYDKSTHDAFAIAKEQRIDVHATRLHEAPGDMEPDVASAVIQNGRCSLATMMNALKSMLTKVELLGVEDRIDFEFIREVVIKGNKKLIKQVTLALAIVYPEIAMSRDAQRLIGKGPNIWKRAGSLVDQRNFMAMIIERCGYPQADQEYGNNSQECIDAYAVALDHPEAYEMAFGKKLRNLQEQVRDEQGVVIQEAYTVGMFYREMMRNLGWTAKATKRITENGQRVRLYVFNLNCEFRQIVLDGLQNKYAQIIEDAHQQSVTSGVSSKDITNVVNQQKTGQASSIIQSVTEKCIGLYKNMADVIIENSGHQEKFTYSWA